MIDARDGQLDGIDCGVGEDRVVADAIDVIAPNCEQVDKGAPAGPGRPGKLRAKLTKAAKRRIGRVRTGKATLKVAVRSGGTIERFAKGVTLTR